MNQQILEKYADLLLKGGVNLAEGQCLRIAAEPIHWNFVLALEKKAYEMGAKFVKCDLDHPKSVINQANHKKDEYLGTVPAYSQKMIDTFVEEKWASIRFDGPEDPEVFSTMDQKRNGQNVKAQREVAKPFMAAAMSGKCRWCVAALPTPNWAAKVMGGEANEETVNKFWEVLIPILRLDKEDPYQTWKNHSDELKRRCKMLDDSTLDHVHFTGPGTDLKVYMNEKSTWVGGAFTSEDSSIFFPNLPTEEVFTTPAPKRTEGTVKVTRPVKVLGTQVHNAWFKFSEGKVVDYGADKKGKEVLTQYFEIDPQAKFLGEVALVDGSSPIFKSEKVFDSILYDENAACHIALGSGISMGIKGGADMNEKELEDVGCNKSLLHTDFMIGSPEISVKGYTRDNKEIEIINKGIFAV